MAASVGDWVGDANVLGASPERDRVGRIEETGIDYIPEAARDSRPANLAMVFFGGNLAFSVIVFGWLPITFGLELVEHGHRERPRARDRHARDRAARPARHAHRHEQHGLQRRALRRPGPARRLRADARLRARLRRDRRLDVGRRARRRRPPADRHPDRRRRAGGRLRADRDRDRHRRALRPRDRRRAAEDRRAGRRRAAAARHRRLRRRLRRRPRGRRLRPRRLLADVDARRHGRGRRPALLRPQPRRLHAPDLAQAPRRPPRAVRRGRRRLPRPARDDAVRRLHRGHVREPERLLRRRPRRRRARLVRPADPRDRARGRRRPGRAEPLRERPRPRGAGPEAAPRPHDADHVGRRRRAALRRHVRARRGQLDHGDDARAQRPRGAVGGRQPPRLPARPARPLRPRRPPGLQPGPPRRALLVHRRLEPARRRSPGPPARCSGCSRSRPSSTPARWRTSPAASTSASSAPAWSPASSTSSPSSSGPSPRRSPHDRSTDPLGRLRREARLRRPDVVRRPPLHRGPGGARRRGRGDRRRADGRAHLRRPRNALRAAGDPRRELRGRRPPRGARRRPAQRAAGGRLRRRADPPRRPGALASGDRGDRR